MPQSHLKRLLALVLVLACFPALAMPPLVDANWLKSNSDKKDLVVLDIQEATSFSRYHIPDAINLPYSKWRTDGKRGPSGMRPSTDKLEKMLGSAGIGNDSQVVIVATGQGAGDMAAAARVFWTLMSLGHETASVLNGGLVAYANSGKVRLAKGMSNASAKTFKASESFKAAANAEQIKSLLGTTTALVDARSVAEHMGIWGTGTKERAGAIPGSANLPYDWLTVNGSAQLRETDKLRRLYKEAGVPLEGEQIHYCASGNRAALTWFVSYALMGNKQARLYDASMNEWSKRRELPIETKLKL